MVAVFPPSNVSRSPVDVLLFYVSQGARFIRLDAIAFLWKEVGTACLHLPGTHRVIQLMRCVLEEVAPRTLIITETNVPHVDNLSYFGNGTDEAHLVYNFALPPLVLHTLAGGDSTQLTRWAQSLALPSEEVTFFNFLASHDGIGLNPVRGILGDDEIDALVARTLAHGGFISYKNLPDGTQLPYEMNINFFDALSNPAGAEPLDIQVARMLCAHAIQLALAGLPGIYFHSLFGSRGDRDGAETSGIHRRINREKLTCAALDRDLAEPGSLRTRVFAGLSALLHARRGNPAFHPSGRQEIVAADPRLFAVARTSLDHRELVVCVQNISATHVDATIPSDTPQMERFRGLPIETLHGPPGSVVRDAKEFHVSLPPYAVAWARVTAT
jgi:sucrose phosphorylase